MGSTIMGAESEAASAAYRGSPAVVLASLPRPKRPRHWTGSSQNDVDLGAAALLPGRFERCGARVEETWSSGATASRDGVVLAVSVIGVADSTILGTAYPRTRGILRAAIPRRNGSFVAVRRQRAGLTGWMAGLGVMREHLLPEAAQREALFVRGDAGTASTLLTPDVCAGLLVLGPAFWRLSAGDGKVELSWRAPYFTAEIALPTEAVDIVVAMAHASVTLR